MRKKPKAKPKPKPTAAAALPAEVLERLDQLDRAKAARVEYRAAAKTWQQCRDETKAAKEEMEEAAERMARILAEDDEQLPLFDQGPPADDEETPAAGAWTERQLSTLDLPAAVLKALANEVNAVDERPASVGDLLDFLEDYALTDIKGIGAKAAVKVNAAIDAAERESLPAGAEAKVVQTGDGRKITASQMKEEILGDLAKKKG